MIKNPVVAESWYMIADLRREMLANSFSFLPLYYNNHWHLISDTNLMLFLNRPLDEKRDNLLSMTIEAAITEGRLSLITAKTCESMDSIKDLIEEIEEHPVLVTKKVDNDENIVGIVSAFDLLL
jgi:hypothetical protein